MIRPLDADKGDSLCSEVEAMFVIGAPSNLAGSSVRHGTGSAWIVHDMCQGKRRTRGAGTTTAVSSETRPRFECGGRVRGT